MFHRFAFLGAAVLALLCAAASPGQVQAQHGHDGFHSRFSPGLGVMNRGIDRRFFDPRFGGFDHGFDRRFFDPRFGGFDRQFFDPRFNRDFDRRFFDPRFGGF
jgi:hypothetical protein